jgi:antitoxin HicB
MAKKTLEYYVNLPYKVDIYPEEDGNGYTAIIPDLPGCMTCADTIEELWDMIQEAKELWLEVALEDGDHIPEPAPVQTEEYSGKFTVRIPRSLHRQLANRAKWENTSLNQLVLALLSENMGRWSERKQGFPVQYGSHRSLKPFPPYEFQKLRAIVEKDFSLTPGPEEQMSWDISTLTIQTTHQTTQRRIAKA